MVRKLADILTQQAKDALDDRSLHSRTDARRARKHAEAAGAKLALALVEVTDRQLAKLRLPQAVLDAVLQARAIGSPVARNRALRLVRRELRAEDTVAIQARVARLHQPERGGACPEAEVWRGRLVSGGEEALEAFVQAYPGTDRQRLRTLMRNLRKANQHQRPQAVNALTRTLQQLVAREGDV